MEENIYMLLLFEVNLSSFEKTGRKVLRTTGKTFHKIRLFCFAH